MQPAPSCNRELKKTIQRKKEVKKRKKNWEKKTGEKIYRSKNCTIVSIRSEKNKIALLTWRCYDRRNHVSLFLHLFPSSPCLQLPCSWNSILSKNFINRLDHDFVHLYDHLQASVLSTIRIDVIQCGIELPEPKEYNISSFIIILLRDGFSRITEIRTIKMILSMTIFGQQFSTKLKK